MVEEFWIPRSNERADMAAIGSILEAFEIKSDRDSLKRLPRQINAYGRLFDRCTAVVAERHVTRVLDVLPEWWGVLISTPAEMLDFASVRSPGPNDGVEIETLVRLLWRSEVYDALAELGAEPDPRAGRASLWEAILRVVDLDALEEPRICVRPASGILVARTLEGDWTAVGTAKARILGALITAIFVAVGLLEWVAMRK